MEYNCYLIAAILLIAQNFCHWNCDQPLQLPVEIMLLSKQILP